MIPQKQPCNRALNVFAAFHFELRIMICLREALLNNTPVNSSCSWHIIEELATVKRNPHFQ